MTDRKHVPDLLLEQLALGELPEERAAELRLQMKTDPDLRARFEAIEISNKDIMTALSPARVVPEIERRAGQSRSGFRWAWAAVPLAAAAAVGLFLLVNPASVTDPATSPAPIHRPKSEGIRTKGATELQVFLQTASDPVRLDDNVTLKPGQSLQVKYMAGDSRHGVILSVDGRGSVTQHFPEDPEGSTVLQPGKATAMQRSYELDDAPDFEYFVFVHGVKAPDLTALTKAMHSLKPGQLPPLAPGLEAVTFTVNKVFQ